VERSDFVWGECADNGVEDPAVVEQDEILLAPVVWIDEGWCNARSLHLVEDLTNFFEICDVGAIWVEHVLAMDALREGVDKKLHCAAWMDFEVKMAGDGVLPEHREDLDFGFVPGRELIEREFE